MKLVELQQKKWRCVVDPITGTCKMTSWQHFHVNKFQPMAAAYIRPTYHKTAKDHFPENCAPQLNH